MQRIWPFVAPALWLVGQRAGRLDAFKHNDNDNNDSNNNSNSNDNKYSVGRPCAGSHSSRGRRQRAQET